MQDRLARCHIDGLTHRTLAAHGQQVIEQVGIAASQESRQFDGRPNIGQGIVRSRMLDAVGRRQILELEARRAIVASRPDDAIGSQGMKGAHHIDQVPAGIAVLPLPGIGIDQVAVEEMTPHFVIEAQVVVTQCAGTRLAHRGWMRPANSASGRPRRLACCGVMPVIRQAWGCGR